MKSIKMRLWTSMMTLVFIVIILLWFFQIVFLEDYYTDMKISQVKKQAYETINDIEALNDVEAQSLIDKFAYNNNLDIEIINSEKEAIYITIVDKISNNRKNSHMGKAQHNKGYINEQEFTEILGDKEIIRSYNHHKFGNQIVIMGLPLELENNKLGAMIINMPLTQVKDTVYILKRQLLYISIILLIISTAIAFLLARVFTEPILKIQKTTRKIAKGDFSERLDVERKDEIGRLGQSINEMSIELSKIEELRKDLIANVSHELRTPLSIIQGYAEIIKDVSGEEKEEREKHLNIIIDESQRLGMVVDDILNLSQLQSRYIEIKTSKTSINDLIYSVVEKYSVLSKELGARIEVNLDDDVELMIDKIKIEQVLHNIINNSFNHIEKGGTINITTDRVGDSLKVIIKDDGVGILEKDLEKIWDRYYKDDKSSKRGNLGTGLGLSIVKNILESHNAEYGVDSIVGMATTFWFKFKTK